MSALGQKQTFAPQKTMSALPPKADTCDATRDSVRCGIEQERKLKNVEIGSSSWLGRDSLGRRVSFIGAESVGRLLGYRCRQRQPMRIIGPEHEACRKQQPTEQRFGKPV